ncbi:MAG: helix-turn-helix domain-containing protein [Paracoccus sp. (in: a-proteobacteria)]|uniref:helix-turn-helix domain-containing protein n=1 Tax=Paracoccus sp. TaxID=267 RepID=UPI0026E06945|nr:helix-turn-helix domain-containing protein [Paracoccus sp. (in: a-proteobacteria)]MDO5631616.1 helix-turn-helix domain-containing protein [Paracoccus sp. (in: a-proteobacteria)]
MKRRAQIQKSINWAQALGLISDGVYQTAKVMASFVLDDFQRPVCAVEVLRLAKERRKHVSTIRRHIAALEDAGLVERQTAGNGLRGSFFGGAVVFGINFAPALERHDELCEAYRRQCHANTAFQKARLLFSRTKAHLRRICEQVDDHRTLEWVLGLDRPSRLPASELRRLTHECSARVEALQAVAEHGEQAQITSTERRQPISPDRAIMRAAPREIGRHYTDTNKKNNNSNTAVEAGENSHEDVLGKLTPEMLARIAPKDWREWIENFAYSGKTGWDGFILTAQMMLPCIGGSGGTWDRIVRMAGPQVASVLVLLAASDPSIRNPDRWIVSMTGRACSQRFNWQAPIKRLVRQSSSAALVVG